MRSKHDAEFRKGSTNAKMNSLLCFNDDFTLAVVVVVMLVRLRSSPIIQVSQVTIQAHELNRDCEGEIVYNLGMSSSTIIS